MILFAICAGFKAQTLAQATATRDWERAHQPTLPIWEHALGVRGFHLLKDPQLLQQTARSLPAMLDDLGSIWITPNSRWVAVILPNNTPEAEPVTIYCLDCKAPQKNWEEGGSGWSGFENTLSRIDRLKPEHAKPTIKIKKLTPFDRREIRY